MCKSDINVHFLKLWDGMQQSFANEFHQAGPIVRKKLEFLDNKIRNTKPKTVEENN